MRPRDSGTRESRPHAGEAAGPGGPAGFWSPWGVNTVSEAGVRTGGAGRPHGATQIVCRARRPSQRFRTRKTLGRVERHRHADGIGKGVGMPRASHCSRMSSPWLRVDSRQAEEQQGAKCVDAASHARLPKPILLGRRIGSRAKLDGVGIGAIVPYARDPQVDNHQR